MANHRTLEVTSSGGKIVAAYLTFARRPGDRTARASESEPGLVVDHAEDGRAIGLEVTAPSRVTLDAINRVLTGLGQPPATAAELAPLFATRGGAAVGATGG